LAGTPATIALAGTSWVTTAPAPTIAPSPIVTPGTTVTAAPSHTFATDHDRRWDHVRAPVGIHAVVEPGLVLMVYTAEPGSPSAERLRLLASWAAPADIPINNPSKKQVEGT